MTLSIHPQISMPRFGYKNQTNWSKAFLFQLFLPIHSFQIRVESIRQKKNRRSFDWAWKLVESSTGRVEYISIWLFGHWIAEISMWMADIWFCETKTATSTQFPSIIKSKSISMQILFPSPPQDSWVKYLHIRLIR